MTERIRRSTLILVVTLWTCGCRTGGPPSASMTSDADTRSTAAEAAASEASPPARNGEDGPRVIDFRPGIRIDFRRPQVEVAAEVILRRGELELFAYSRAPTPKEHETILVLDARPEAIYQALGLIGLTPGAPMSYDGRTQKVTPPTGDPVDVRVRHASEAGGMVEVSACEWMWDLNRRAPMRQSHWLFTGSKRLENGRFFANVDGTTVSVVNFDSALLALPELHSESDANLWLAARTDVIPPVGTKVTLILRPAARP